VDRRSVLQAGGALAAGGVLAACSGGTTAGPAGPQPAAAGQVTTVASGAPGTLAAVADVPVGSGVIFADPAVVVTQPTAGDLRCFSAVCTHQGCLVGSVADNQIVCPCHGSVFSAEDGSVLTGPAFAPLPKRAVHVADGMVVLDEPA